MARKNTSLALVGALAVATVSATSVSANEMTSETEGSSQGQYQTKPETNDAAYWQAKKEEAQKRSTEMRAKKIEEMKAKGYDVSSIGSDLLDATKTDEGAFWKAVGAIQNAHEIEARKKKLEELKSKGYDVSTITEDVIADGQKFWDAVKKLTSNGSVSAPAMGKPAVKPENRPTGSELEAYLRSDLSAEEKAAVAKLMAETGKRMAEILNDQSLTVEEKVSKVLELHRVTAEKIGSEYVDASKLEAYKSMTEKRLATMADYVRQGMQKNASGIQKPEERRKNVPTAKNENRKEDREDKKEDRKEPRQIQAPAANVFAAISPKLRKDLETKLREIPDDKKAAFYERAKTILEKQIEKAKAANKPKQVAKLRAVLAVVEDVVGPENAEDASIIDSIFSSDSTAQ